MRSSVFQYPYKKVFRKTEDALSKLGMKIVSSNAVNGSIKAKSGFSLLKPGLEVSLVVEEMENDNTRVTITGISVIKNRFFQKKEDAELSESAILEALSSII